MAANAIGTHNTRWPVGRRRLLRAGGVLAGAATLLRVPAVNPAAAAGPAPRLDERSARMAYRIEGRLLEVCTCNTLCPCWVGEDPDGGTCDSSFAYRIDKGTIEGIDVSGRILALSVHIPGNVLAGNWRAVVYVDDGSTEEQQAALLKVFTGQLGGAVADFAGLIGEVVAVERAPIAFEVEDGKGTFAIGTTVAAELAPFKGLSGATTTLNDTAFSTIPGAPAYPGKATYYRREEAEHGLATIDIRGQNAIQGFFLFEA